MASHLGHEVCCVRHCYDVYEQNSIVNSVSVDDWTAESENIANDVLRTSFFFLQLCNFSVVFTLRYQKNYRKKIVNANMGV